MTCTTPDRCGINKCYGLSDGTYTESPLKCPYFVVVVGPMWSNDPESYASGSISTDRASPPEGWNVMTQKERDILLLQFGSWDMKITTSPQYKLLLLRSLIMDAGWTIVVKYQGKVIRTMKDEG